MYQYWLDIILFCEGGLSTNINEIYGTVDSVSLKCRDLI
jgi:hypothetical protein